MNINKQAFVNQDKCRMCSSCPAMEECPTDALQLEDGFLFVGLGCLGCGTCVKACPYRAVEMI